MSQQTDTPQGTIVSVKRVRKAVDVKNRERVVLTFGTDSKGRNGVNQLITALQELSDKQINFDIRLGKQKSESGKEFDTAFVIVKEMVPKDAETKTTYAPKKEKAKSDLKARASAIAAELE